MKPVELTAFLDSLVRHRLKLSTMIWGPPGIGKSSIVAQTARAHKLQFVDVRLSQLAPTDLRGLPVASKGISRWYPPEFLPRTGKGVLFLDEINLAPPTMQGMAQQLILDRRVGSYVVPAGWFIWAAGNRSEDRAAVFDMPAPLANRFLHLEVQPDLESFKNYALAMDVHEHIIAFISFRPELLHKLDPQQPAWPSPRSWVMASHLHQVGLDITSAIGAAAATEFYAYTALYHSIPDLAQILRGEGEEVAFPTEPSMRYATVVGLLTRAADDPQTGYHAFRWMTRTAPIEWVQLCATDLFRLMRARQKIKALFALINQDPILQKWMDEYRQLIGESSSET
jgi:MoxR-like ATPase